MFFGCCDSELCEWMYFRPCAIHVTLRVFVCMCVNNTVFFIIVPLIFRFYDVWVAENKCKYLQKCAHKYTHTHASTTYYFPFDGTETPFLLFFRHHTYFMIHFYAMSFVHLLLYLFVFPSYLWDTQWASVFMCFASSLNSFVVHCFFLWFVLHFLLLLLLFSWKYDLE